jgi:hypothetical protein
VFAKLAVTVPVPFSNRLPAPEIAAVENVVLPLPEMEMFDVADVVTPPENFSAFAAESLFEMKKSFPAVSTTGTDRVSVPVVPVKLIPVPTPALFVKVSVLPFPLEIVHPVVPLKVMLPIVRLPPLALLIVNVVLVGVPVRSMMAPEAFGTVFGFQNVVVPQLPLVPIHVCASALPLVIAINNTPPTTLRNRHRSNFGILILSIASSPVNRPF